MKKLHVNVANGYDILIEKGIFSECGKYIKEVSNAKKVCLISDTNVFPIYGDIVLSQLKKAGYETYHYVFQAGEESKTPQEVFKMVEFMAENGLTRNDLAIALGGGVCGDMTGFAAAIFLRGIDFVQMPTSLLADVDSSVGGKTGADLPQGKNLIGAFHQPKLVIIDPNTLDTLTPHFFSDGMAEAIKTGCIKDASLFERIEKEDAKDIIEDIIYGCVKIKAQVVENDEKEHGERALLNFGHTVGHAIEKLHNFATISHGEAVGVGMVMITDICEKQGLTKKGTSKRIADVLEKFDLKIKDDNAIEDIVKAMGADKKRTGTDIKFVVLDEIGESRINPIEYDKILPFFTI